jgi:putative protease
MRTAPAPGAAGSIPARARPEVLAPAGDFECVRAAVENGADAVYFGVQKFNARARARNFAPEELPDLFSFLRLRGVRGYVAFNTLVFSNELDEAERLLERILAAGPDAFILQDLGIARLLREMAPGVPLHASTQTTTTCAEQMGLLRELGFSRVILARELSIEEIRRIRAATDMSLEVFVHGALCVAYSGQCLTSEALGGRSANRGACAQACRLPYELVVDGAPRDLGDRRYLLSPLDLAAPDLVPELAGLVDSIKIEGRLKSAEYVAAATRAYRKAVDEAVPLSRDEELALRQVFSRGFSHGFLSGVNHQALVEGRSPRKRGLFLGRVSAVRGRRAEVTLQAPLKPGDGVVFDFGNPEADEPGGRVLHLWRDGRRVETADAPDVVEFEVRGVPPPRPGWKLWKTDDPAINRGLRATFERTGTRVPVDAVVEECDGRLRVTFTDGERSVRGEAGPLQPAHTRPLTAEYLREHLGRLGQTPFELRGLDVRLGSVMLPVSRLNDLRRRLAEELAEARRRSRTCEIRPGALGRLRRTPPRTAPEEPRLVVLCRSLEQLAAALEEGIRFVACDFEDIRRYREAASGARAAGARILLAPPRVHKPGELGILRSLLGAGGDGFLVRSTAHLDFYRREAPGAILAGDFSLNVANELAAETLLSRGLERFVPSYDLTWEQLQALLERVDPGRAEVVVHQHMPLFHMEHCVFAAFLSTGKDSTDCGRPCDRHRVELRDRAGMAHPVRADVGCRNTVYNAVPQSASPYVRGLLERGVRWFRLELLGEDASAARRLVRAYRELLAGRGDGHVLWKELRASSVLGVTRGPLGSPAE